MSLEHFKATFTALGQGHIFEGVDELSEQDQQVFVDTLKSVDLPKIVSNLQDGLQSMSQATAEISAFQGECVDIRNVNVQGLLYELEDGAKVSSNPEISSAYTNGVASIARGEVGLVMLAGGQGSRLGFNHPKGMFPIDPSTGVSIFELHSYRLRRLLDIAQQAHPTLKARLPWIIMTSSATHTETVQFFATHDHFGLPKADIIFFQQAEVPAIAYLPADASSVPATTIDHPTHGRIALKLVMRSPGVLALAPNGNGGIWPGVAPAMAGEPGLRYLHVLGVDNILTLSADPLMVGTMATRGLSVLNKVVVKEVPEEKVGLMASRAGKTIIVEYSEMQEKSLERNPDGSLVYCDANIGSMMFSREFFDRAIAHVDALHWHLAEGKNVPCAPRMAAAMGMAGSTTGSVKATKCELFMFDVLHIAATSEVGVFRTLRQNQFAPVKNSDDAGFDSPATAQALLANHHRALLAGAGVPVPADANDKSVLIHVAKATYAGEGLRGADLTAVNGSAARL